MLTFDPKLQSELAAKENHRIRVIGVGGAGVNMLDRIKLNKVNGLDLCVTNTDQRALQGSVVDDRVQLGAGLTRGLGSGGDPDLGQAALEASREEMMERVNERDLVFLCGGLGGGTASGALPVLAQMARDAGAFVVAFVTMPFFFEGRRRSQQAQESLDKLNLYAHALMTFPNDRMNELVDADEGIHSAFSKVDQLIAAAVSSISQMISRPGLVHLGLDDLITALEDNRHECLFGWGEARGKKRVSEAVSQALKSPLLEKEKLSKQASKVLVHVCGGQDLSLHEVEEVMKEITQFVHPEAHVLFGTGVDPQQDALQVTLISSLGNTALPEIVSDQAGSASEAAYLDGSFVEQEVEATGGFDSEQESFSAEEDQGLDVEEQNLADESSEPEAVESELIEEAEEPETQAGAEVEEEVTESSEQQLVEAELPTDAMAEQEAEQAVEQGSTEAAEAAEEVQEVETAEEAIEEPLEAEPSEELTEAAEAEQELEAQESAKASEEAKEEPSSAKPVAEAKKAVQVKLVRQTSKKEVQSSAKAEAQAQTKPKKGRVRESKALDTGDLFAADKAENRGRFADSDPTVEDGEDLDLPTFLRKKNPNS